jgi:hypothetical protein
MMLNDPTASEGERRHTLQSIGLLVCCCLSLVVGALLAVGALGDDGAATVGASETINPNTAPVGSLIRLPGIGLTRARAIAAHRDAVRDATGERIAFRVSDDLQQIKGIGPKTATDIAVWLGFDALASDAPAHPDGEWARP